MLPYVKGACLLSFFFLSSLADMLSCPASCRLRGPCLITSCSLTSTTSPWGGEYGLQQAWASGEYFHILATGAVG